jgi:hypothetical protein
MFRTFPFQRIGVLLLLPLCVAQGQTRHDSPEYRFFRTHFERTNANYCRTEPGECQKALDEAFDAIAQNVAKIQLHAPKVSLGAMLSLIYWESNDSLAFYNTRDKENSFKKYLRSDQPYFQQPLARYSYQFGLIPFHMSNFRPCVAGTQPARKRFSELLSQAGMSVSQEQLAGVQEDFEKVCQSARRPVRDQVMPVDYFILSAHRDFHVPINSAGSDYQELQSYPFYFSRITAPFFFSPILGASGGPKATVSDDCSAIVAWGGGDAAYRQNANRILQAWIAFSNPGSAAKASDKNPCGA